MRIKTKCAELPEIVAELPPVTEVPKKSPELSNIVLISTKLRIHNKMSMEIKSVNIEPSLRYSKVLPTFTCS